MTVKKGLDERHLTQGGGVIRVETWVDCRSGAVVKYNLADMNSKRKTAAPVAEPEIFTDELPGPTVGRIQSEADFFRRVRGNT